MSTNFNPTLSRVLRIDELPESCSFIEEPLNNILKNFYVKNLIEGMSEDNDLAYYNLILMTDQNFRFGLLGSGLFIVVNPPLGLNTIQPTEFPVTVFRRWEILKYVKDFNLQNFSFSLGDLYEKFREIYNIEEEDILNSIIRNFILPDFITQNPETTLLDAYDHFQTFIDDLESRFNLTTPIVLSQQTIDFDDLFSEIKNYIETYNLPNFNFLEIAKDYINDSIDNLETLLKPFLQIFNTSSIKKMLIPEFYIRFNDLSLGLEFPRSILQPIDPGTNEAYVDENIKSFIRFTAGNLMVSTVNGIEFEETYTITFDKSEILKTGIRLSFSEMKLDLSRTKNIPEAVADGRPDDFTGVFIKSAEIDLPEKWFKKHNNATLAIYGKNLLIGTGGISGTLGLMASDGSGTPANGTDEFLFNFGKTVNNTFDPNTTFAIGFNYFDITFQQNAFVDSNIKGKFHIPKKILTNDIGGPVIIDIDVHFDKDGDFKITAKEKEGITFYLPSKANNILSITVKSLTVGKTEDKFYLAIAGTIDFNVNIPVLGDCLPKGIHVEKLLIWEDGSMEFVGGLNLMPIPKEVPLGPVTLSISSLSIGSHEQMYNNAMCKYRYFGFDGGINVNPGGVDARVNGVKFYYNLSDWTDFFLRIEGIKIDLVIPGTASKETAAVILHGFLKMKNPETPESNAGEEYTGGISLSLPKFEISASAAMRLNPKKPAFIVDMELDKLSSPILLGTTGLGIYGFRGLIGSKYVADKESVGLPQDASWYQYYKAPPKEGITVDKFSQRNGFALGAGVTVATATDSGKAFSSKLFFLLSLPDVFLLQGQGTILSKRIGLDTTPDPPFSALIAITNQSVEAAFGINFGLPGTEETSPGSIIKVDGLIEMGFFYGNSSAWYINIGRDTPPEKRIQARIINLFNAYAYLMLSASGIKAGAGASWEFNKKFGPVRLELGAYLDVAGHISFQPKQIGGAIQLGGYARIAIFKFKFGFSIAAALSAEVAKPFLVTGSITLIINLPKPFKDIEISVDFTWVFETDLHIEAIPLVNTIDNPNMPFASAKNIHTKESFQVYSSISGILPDPIMYNSLEPIPLDSYIDVELIKSVWPWPDGADASVKRYGNKHDVIFFENFAPQKAYNEQVQHQYKITNIKIYTYNENTTSWAEYDVYKAASPMQALLGYSTNDWNNLTQDLKYGYWQEETARCSKLRVLACTPLTFINNGSGNIIIENLGINGSSIFCPPIEVIETCVNFENLNYDIMPAGQMNLLKNLILIRITGDDGEIISIPQHFNVTKALQLMPGNKIELFFTESISTVHIGVTTKAPYIKITYFKYVQNGVDYNNVPVYEYQAVVPQKTYHLNELLNPIEYSDLLNPIVKIEIETGICEELSSLVCENDITNEATLFRIFLNALATNHNLITAQFNLYTNPAYQSTFSNTILYDGTHPDLLHYESVNSLTVLTATISDDSGFVLDFGLEIQQPNALFNYANIVGLSSLRPDPAHLSDQANKFFLVDALTNVPGGQQTFVLKGQTSKYSIVKCKYDNRLLNEDRGRTLQEDQAFILLDKGDDVSASCSTLIYGLCWLTTNQELYSGTFPTSSEVQAQNEAMVMAINETIQPIWRPNTKYLIRIIAEDNVYKTSDFANTLDTHSNCFDVGFRTKGPLGFFHQTNSDYLELLGLDRQDEYKLASLRYYIDYSKSYPNADGNILKAKPLFYENAKLLMFYTEAYVPMMFMDWAEYNGLNNGVQINLEAVIKDPAEATINPDNIAVVAEWVKNDHPIIAGDIAVLNNLILNTIPCANFTFPLAPIGTNAVFALPTLKPLKLYTALFNSKIIYPGTTEEKSEVLRYGFQTSRYKSFNEQVQSYVLSSEPGNEKYAIFKVDKAIATNDIQKAQQIIAGTLTNDPENLLQRYQDEFERIVDGALKMETLAPAVTTEFNILRDITDPNNIIVRGLLIRNPEPFNDPKLPKDVMQGTIDVTQYGGGIFNVYFSKDKARVFVTNNILELTVSPMDIIFNYMEFDGQSFYPASSENVQIELT